MITAKVHSDDYLVEITFDATEWFDQAPGFEIEDLAACEWGGDQPADYVTFFYDETKTKRLFDYLSLNPTMGFKNDPVGFECHVDETEAMNWLKQNRNEVYRKLTEQL
jgi:hypothetical protein